MLETKFTFVNKMANYKRSYVDVLHSYHPHFGQYHKQQSRIDDNLLWCNSAPTW